MCLTFCRVREILYDSDTDEVCRVCPHNLPDGKACETCAHCKGNRCELTRADLPECGWCCHATATAGCHAAAAAGCHATATAGCHAAAAAGCHHAGNTRHAPLAEHRDFAAQHLKGFLPPIRAALDMFGAIYEDIGRGWFRVQMASLSVPLVYGVPTVHWVDELAPGPASELSLVDLGIDGEFVLEL